MALAGVDRAAALPVGEGAAGLFQDRQQRGEVPDGHHGIDHQLGPAGGHHQVAVAVAPGAAQPGGGLQAVVDVAAADLVERGHLAGEEQALGQGRAAGDAGRPRRLARRARTRPPAPPPRRRTRPGPGCGSRPRPARPSCSMPISVPYSGTPWMNDLVPSIGSRIQRKGLLPGRSGNSSPRMASSAKAAAMRSPQVLLGPAVGHRHRRVVALALDLQVVAAEVLQGDLARLAGRLQGQRQTGRHLGGVEAHWGRSCFSEVVLPGLRFGLSNPVRPTGRIRVQSAKCKSARVKTGPIAYEAGGFHFALCIVHFALCVYEPMAEKLCAGYTEIPTQDPSSVASPPTCAAVGAPGSRRRGPPAALRRTPACYRPG